MRYFLSKVSIVFFILIISVSILSTEFIRPLSTVFAQTPPPNEAAISAREAELNAQLAQTEQEIAQWKGILESKQKESASLERDAAILNAKIQQQKLIIKAHDLEIQRLGKDIGTKEKVIGDLNSKIDRGKESLSQLIRKTNEIDSLSLATMVLSNNDLSDFFSDLDSFDTIKKSLEESFVEIRKTEQIAQNEKQILGKKKDQETDTKVAIEVQKREVEKNEAEKKSLLKISKTQEKTYEQVLKDRQAKAAQIRSALFSLRDTAAIPFGKALEYAQFAQEKTGVRAAFLLGILTQESNLGQNTGSCYLKDSATGSGVSVKTGLTIAKVMKPDRDVSPFMTILQGVGRDPYQTRVSCPQSVGWGGAMGPAQFIPSTWILMQTKISGIVGKPVPDPWDPRDAITASAIFLSDLGASGGSYTSEMNAACRYYSGKACSASSLIKSYGTGVMTKAQNIQENMINPLQNL
jgi:membrane-bound lytic murein transglycosylase B